jgi:hypothetical protein
MLRGNRSTFRGLAGASLDRPRSVKSHQCRSTTTARRTSPPLLTSKNHLTKIPDNTQGKATYLLRPIETPTVCIRAPPSGCASTLRSAGIIPTLGREPGLKSPTYHSST